MTAKDGTLWHRAIDPTPWTALYTPENGYTQLINAKGEPVMDDDEGAVFYASRELAEFIAQAVNTASAQSVAQVGTNSLRESTK